MPNRTIPTSATESLWHAPDGYAIRRVDWLQQHGGDGGGEGVSPRGSLLFLPGRGDFYEKYLETLDHWAGCGWQVTSVDWRGQAGSGRFGKDSVTGHIEDFGVWVDDLAAFWAQWQAETPGPHVVVGHSMGGHLVLRAVAEGRIRPAGLVLVAPMLDFATSALPRWLLHAVAKLMVRIGDPRRPAWQWSEKPGEPPASRIALLTHDETRYADELFWRQARPGLGMGPGSWGWVERAYASMRKLARPGVLEGVGAPVLVLATKADRLVSARAAVKAAGRLPHAELLLFGPEARHEILRETDSVRNRALQAIDRFLDRVAPAA